MAAFFLFLLVVALHAERNRYEDYFGIITKDLTSVYDVPGYLFTKVVALLEKGRHVDILEVSENVYVEEGRDWHYYKVQSGDGTGWIDGRNAIVVGTKGTCRAWYQRSGYRRYLSVLWNQDRYSFSHSETDMAERGTWADTPFLPGLVCDDPFSGVGRYNATGGPLVISIQWDSLNGGYRIQERSDDGSRSYEMEFHENGDFLPHAMRIANMDEESFWVLYGKRDFRALESLFGQGYAGLRSPMLPYDQHPLCLSIAGRDFEMIRFLLDHGVSQTAAGMYTPTSILAGSIARNDLEMASFLLDNGMKRNLGVSGGNDLLSCLHDSRLDMIRLLVGKGYDVNALLVTDLMGTNGRDIKSLLLRAVEARQFRAAALLIGMGADVNFIGSGSRNDFIRRYTALDVAGDCPEEFYGLLRAKGARSADALFAASPSPAAAGFLWEVTEGGQAVFGGPGLETMEIGRLERGEKLKALYSHPKDFTPGDPRSVWHFVLRDNGQTGWIPDTALPGCLRGTYRDAKSD